jgi:hypothetical protein
MIVKSRLVEMLIGRKTDPVFRSVLKPAATQRRTSANYSSNQIPNSTLVQIRLFIRLELDLEPMESLYPFLTFTSTGLA